jgi:crotonobetainyl-CoA:carnitine CoA-transferase CaiB-like acyl-CoA transferase
MLGAWRKVAPVESNAELNRMRRLEAWSDIVGRPVETSTDLTRDEGWRIAQAINRVEDGDAVVVEQADGWLRVRDWPDVAPTEPPDDDPELPL